MEAILESDPTYEDMNWDRKTVVAANGLLKMHCSFTFIVSFIVTMNAMSIIKPISVKLQNKSSDIVKAYMDITEVINELSSVRESEDMLHSWYEQAESLAQEVGVIPQVPRVTSRQIHRDNTEHNSVEEYYRRIVVLPLLDHLIQQMKERFGKTQSVVARLIKIVPSIVSTLDHVCLEDLICSILTTCQVLH